MLRAINSKEALEDFLQSRELATDQEVLASSQEIIAKVRVEKDQALRHYTKLFDQVELSDFLVSGEEIRAAKEHVEAEFLAAMTTAINNIRTFHQEQKSSGYEIKPRPGVELGQRVIPLDRVGVYVPGGTAAYPSSVAMNVVPAQIAGVREIVMVTPPQADKSVNPYILATADLLGVKEIYKVGGAQAVAALAYGTESIRPVDKIVGPGNAYVAAAKRLVYGKVDIDMIAGPSEVLVIADNTANPRYVAADLLAQAEHDPMASSILLSTSEDLIVKVNQAIKDLLARLQRQEIIKEALANFGVSIKLYSIEDCIECSNLIAPEHLEIMLDNAKDYLPLIKHAGSIFLGPMSCEALGDYIAGPNHVLPTNGTARFSSGLNVDSFIKKDTYMSYTKEALQKEATDLITIARHEQLDAHALAAEVRVLDDC